MKPLSELIAGSMLQKQGQSCWYATLSTRAKEFIDEVQRLLDGGKPIVIARATTILHEEFGLKTGASIVRKHLRGECQCPRKQPKVSPKKR